MEFTGIIMFPIILKQLAWEKLEWPFADSVTVWATWQYPLQARTWFSRRQHPKYGAAFPKTRITNPRIKKWTRKGHHSLAPLVTHWQKFCFLSQDYMFCWPESLNFKGEKKSFHQETQEWFHRTGIQDYHLATLVSPGLWISKNRGSYNIGWGNWSWLPKGNWTTTPRWREGRASW